MNHHWEPRGAGKVCSACALETVFRYPHRNYYLQDPTGRLRMGLVVHSRQDAIVVAQSPPHRRGQPRDKAWSCLCPPCPGRGGDLVAALLLRVKALQCFVAERPCPSCLVRPGIWCKTLYVHPCPELHAGRRQAEPPVVPTCVCGALRSKKRLWCAGCWWDLPVDLREAVIRSTDKEARRAAVRRALAWIKDQPIQQGVQDA